MQDATKHAIHSKWGHLQRAVISLMLLIIVATAPADTLKRLSDVFTYMPPPRYPIDAWVRTSTGSRRIEGRAVCRVTLNADGTVARVELADTSGSKILDHASVEALREWRARPGRPGPFYNIPINFTGRGSTLGNDNGMEKAGPSIMGFRDR
ncbi:MAG: periplasmic protein TonB [Verrucomicrobiota bacterium]|jgi:TonB family protein